MHHRRERAERGELAAYEAAERNDLYQSATFEVDIRNRDAVKRDDSDGRKDWSVK